MAFANFILVVFLLVSLLVFIVLVMLIRQIKKDGRLPSDKITTLSAILFIPTILIFALISKGVLNWRSDIQFEKEQVEINQFVQGVYKPLAGAQRSLLHSFSEMHSLLQDTKNMELKYLNHAGLISDITQQWRSGQGALYKAYNNTDKEIRRAWISYKTMDQQDVLTKFSKQAVQLEQDIKKADNSYQQHIHGVQDELIKNLDRARKLLNANRKPPKSKKLKALNQETLEKIRPFKDSTVAELVGFLTSIDARLKDELVSLQQLINIAAQQGEIIRSHLFRNQDLEQPLTIIINNWKVLETDSQQRLNQVLYAIEAEYVALKLGLSQDSPAIKAMHESLLLDVPAIVSRAMKQRKVIDQSYSIKRAN